MKGDWLNNVVVSRSECRRLINYDSLNSHTERNQNQYEDEFTIHLCGPMEISCYGVCP